MTDPRPADLPAAWRTLADTLRPFAAGVALAYERAADELDTALEAERGALLTLAEAARVSGYSADHLARLIRAGKLASVGDRHRPRVRRGDLPLKPVVARRGPALYDVNADARDVLASRRGAS
ncbi:MAG: helix-turn-helix domain-containing protein [Dehalococcoidia bacterium]|nr:helix-turn-helix domain-containing protein [Dehalococcoidia bacterium]